MIVSIPTISIGMFFISHLRIKLACYLMILPVILVYSICTHIALLLSLIDCLAITVSTLMSYYCVITTSYSFIISTSLSTTAYSIPIIVDTFFEATYAFSTTTNFSTFYHSTPPQTHMSSPSDSTTPSINLALCSNSMSGIYGQENSPILFYCFLLLMMASMMTLPSSYIMSGPLLLLTMLYSLILLDLYYYLCYYEITCYSSSQKDLPPSIRIYLFLSIRIYQIYSPIFTHHIYWVFIHIYLYVILFFSN